MHQILQLFVGLRLFTSASCGRNCSNDVIHRESVVPEVVRCLRASLVQPEADGARDEETDVVAGVPLRALRYARPTGTVGSEGYVEPSAQGPFSASWCAQRNGTLRLTQSRRSVFATTNMVVRLSQFEIQHEACSPALTHPPNLCRSEDVAVRRGPKRTHHGLHTRLAAGGASGEERRSADTVAAADARRALLSVRAETGGQGGDGGRGGQMG